ncbi:hypothetical protein JCM5353_002083 [Sporobolomyces roseus]
MAWTCTGSTHSELVSNLVQHGILKTPRVIQAFKNADRKYYVPVEKHDDGTEGNPYIDSPARIGFGATISASHMHAYAVEALEPFLKPGSHVLDIGSGSGYLLSIFSQLVSPPSGPHGSVLGIDHLPSLISLAHANLSSDPSSSAHLHSNTIRNILSDGRLGAPSHALPEGFKGFDAIHVGAASSEFPDKLVEQLKEGGKGRMFVPVGKDWGEQWIWVVDKDEMGKVEREKLMRVNYIPLTDPEKQYTGL